MFLEITKTANYQFTDCSGKRSYSCTNHNAFLQMMDGALSGKTGFTGNAGYCYVGALKRDDRTFIVALLACGWPNNKTYKWADTKKLMQYGISRFRKISLDEIELDAGEYAPVQVVDGQGTKIGEEVTTELEVAPVKENVELLIEKDQEVHIEYQLSRKLYAPVTEGDFIGEITYLLGDEVLAKRVVTVKNTVKRIDFCWCVKKTAELFPM
jgi:D-alanyl-D-alanine carboxypeptidase (penicillin-binding protein 5/6)